MSEELTLLPCPACGEEADIFDSFERDGNGHVAIGWSAYCTRGCLATSEHGSREKAAASWNALPRAKELEKKVDHELSAAFGGVQMQRTLL